MQKCLLVFVIVLFGVSNLAAQWSGDPKVNNPICLALRPQTRPKVVTDGAGGAIFTWKDYRKDAGGGTDTTEIYAQRINASGSVQWAVNGVSISTAISQASQIVSDDAGGAIISWIDFRSGNAIDFADVYAQRINASGIAQWPPNGVPICTNPLRQVNGPIVSDGAGGAIIMWMDDRNGFSSRDVYAQRINTSGVVQWPANGVAICTATNDQVVADGPGAISDGAGGAIITWSDFRNGTDNDIFAQRINASGVVQWTTDGVAICTATNNQGSAIIASDGAGGAIITWTDARSGADIYAQRINASGVVQWTTNGVAICTAPIFQTFSTITSDGVGGAIITWQDYRNGTDYDIYAQRVNASGVAQWATNGVAMCTATNIQLEPAIVGDGTDGAIITWRDYRSGTNYDIYVQYVNASGVAQWTANGLAMCTASNSQSYPAMVSDNVGGAIVAWKDLRNGDANADIYASHANQNGTLTAVQDAAGEKPTNIFLEQNYPNPFNSTSTIRFQIPSSGFVLLIVHDVMGKEVATLISEQMKAGTYTKQFDANNLTSGVYFYQLRVNNFTDTKKFILNK